jgi:putative FmdB family regulatory protein
MPTYDYQCRTCGHTIEVIHPMSEDGPTVCDVCGGPLRRVIFPAGIIFKGSGFYKTDSRSSSSSSSHAATRSGGTSSDGEAPAAATKKPGEEAKPISGSTDASSGSSAAPPPATGKTKSS